MTACLEATEELRGSNESQLRIVPAGQRLYADNARATQVHLGLEIGLDLPLRQGAHEVGFRRPAVPVLSVVQSHQTSVGQLVECPLNLPMAVGGVWRRGPVAHN